VDQGAGRPAPESTGELADRTIRSLNLVGFGANSLGGIVVFAFTAFLAPRAVSSEEFHDLFVRSAIAFGVIAPPFLLLGRYWSRRLYLPIDDWLRSERPATDADRRRVLRYPLDFAKVAGAIWLLAAVVFPLVNVDAGLVVVLPTGVTVFLGGVTACAVEYLLIDRALRPIAGRALGAGAPPRVPTPGVSARLTMAWGLATAVPILGIVALGVAKLAGADVEASQVLGPSLALAVIALAVGLFAIRLAARGVADPVGTVGRALERVERGDFQVQVAVDDSSEIGLLQAGFNRMAAGLAERERMRDLFGRHVGEDVARAAMEGEVSLGGEVREVAVLFVDVVGSTALASERPPGEVVSLLNAFFAIVVEVTESHRGLINKFEGDAALCVFGAPTLCEDPAGDALCAARELRDRLRQELPDIEAGIGVSAGQAVAGNMGAERRFEYTVIGDPVNEGARLCELSKKRPERLLASEVAVGKARSEEARRWAVGEEVSLRGRGEATRLATAA
jgi:adenylate cyclase